MTAKCKAVPLLVTWLTSSFFCSSSKVMI
jgi:hypothetical protein